jgi:hypothetical protein
VYCETSVFPAISPSFTSSMNRVLIWFDVAFDASSCALSQKTFTEITLSFITLESHEIALPLHEETRSLFAAGPDSNLYTSHTSLYFTLHFILHFTSSYTLPHPTLHLIPHFTSSYTSYTIFGGILHLASAPSSSPGIVRLGLTEIHSQRTPTLNARSIFFLNTNLKN